jgi:hypothetical protein
MIRKGFILPAALMLVCAIILLAATRHYFSRNQLIRAAHDANYEKAFHLAMGGIESADKLLVKAINYCNDSRINPELKAQDAPAEFAAIVTDLLDADGLLLPREKLIYIRPENLDLLQRSWEKFSELEISLEIKDIGPLIKETSLPGINADSRERNVILLLNSEAKVNDTVARVCRYRRAKIVNILPSALGKFVLFLRQQGSLNLNSLEDSLVDKNKMGDTPLIVDSGKSSSIKSIKPEDAADFFEKQGWVFLGGDAPWIVASGGGGGVANFQSALLKNDKQYFSIPPTDSLSSRTDLVYYSQPEFVSKELKNTIYNGALQDMSDEMLLSSRIRISGNAARPSPTNVVGKVISRWALLQGYKNTASGLFSPLPFISETKFAGNNWPGVSKAAAQIINDNFGGSFQNYKARMSTVVDIQYNAINLRALKFANAPLNEAIQIDPEKIPADTNISALSKRLLIEGKPASFVDANYGTRYEIKADDGNKLFNGDLEGFEDLSFFKAKAVENFDKPADFYKKIRVGENEWVIDSTYLIKGDLTIDRPLTTIAGCGGMVFVQGNIVIKEEIFTPTKETIILCSLNGNIEISTSRNVEAGLIALKGTIAANSSIKITGIVAGKDLSLARLFPPGSRKIIYNSNFDATDSLIYKKGFKLFMPK